MVALIILPGLVLSDVVKPALVEITANTNGVVTIEIRASIEALLTGINARYSNTQDAPNAIEYDMLRAFEPDALSREFKNFEKSLLGSIYLKADEKSLPLEVISIDIPEVGYTKVPRMSIIKLQSILDRSTNNLYWYYPQSFGDNAVRVRQVDELNEEWHWSEWQWLKNDQPGKAFSLQALFQKTPVLEVVGSYIVLGYKHIIPRGLDHILFILGLFLIARKLRPLVLQVTMFTIAHTMTLGLSMNGLIELPARIVEPLIALSIAYIAIENIFSDKITRSRLLLVFLFGLLHGLGFASVLSDFGMPRDAFVTALISFNVGVELGQLTILMIAWILFFKLFKSRETYRRMVVLPLSLMIFIVGIYWTIERVEPFW